VWALRQLAAEVKAEPDEVVFLPNATTGLNTVVNSIELAEGDEVSARPLCQLVQELWLNLFSFRFAVHTQALHAQHWVRLSEKDDCS